MRKLTILVALGVAAAILWTTLSSKSGAPATASAAKDRVHHGQHTGTQSGTDTSRHSTTAPGAATIVAGGDSVVYRLDVHRASVTPTHGRFVGISRSMVSTTGHGSRSTHRFMAAWASDPLAGPLDAVVLTSDGVRHSLTLADPVMHGKRLSASVTASDTVPSGLAEETGADTAGVVSGLSGTSRNVTLYLAVTNTRTVHGCQIVRGTVCDGTNLAQSALENTDLTSASLRKTNLWQAGLHGAALVNADLSHAGAYRADLSAVDAHGITAERTDMTQATLAHSDFRHSDLTWAVLRRADLTGADFGDSQLGHLRASDSLGRKAGFSGADLDHARLMSADFTDADFSGADLRGADLAGANLTGADFSGADLTGANLDGAILTRTVFAHVTWQDTKCSDGLVSSVSCA